MKKLVLLFSVLVIGIASINAQSQKKMLGKEVKTPATKEIKKRVSDKTHMRAVGEGFGSQEKSAKKKAIEAAKDQISAMIKQSIKTASEEYVNEATVGDKMEYEEIIESMTASASNNIVSGLGIAGYQLYYKKKEGRYNAYVMMQVEKDEVGKKVVDAITDEQETKVKFNRDKFRAIFNKEVEKLDQAQ